MKIILKLITCLSIATLALSACIKDKKTDPPVEEPAPIVDPPEVITTIRLAITDSITGIKKTYAFKDPDGDGGQIGGFLNESGTHDTIMLAANSSYFVRIYILDESKNPTDSTSNVIQREESKDHMLFYNGNPAATGFFGNTILNTAVPYKIKTIGSNITVNYTDLDNGSPQKSIGLQTKWRTSASTTGSAYPFTVVLRHQPNIKNGTYAPGETDLEKEFKVKVN